MSQSFASPEFTQFVAQLPESQQQEFFTLVKRLQQLGDVSKLDSDERERLLDFANAFAGQQQPSITRREHTTTVDHAATVDHPPTSPERNTPVSTQFLRTPFVALVKDTLNAELCRHGGSLADAIGYAFRHKWLPEQWKDAQFCEQLFLKYKMEIESHNAWRADLEAVHKINEDKRLAVGLAWFNTIFRLQQLLDDGLDLDQT